MMRSNPWRKRKSASGLFIGAISRTGLEHEENRNCGRWREIMRRRILLPRGPLPTLTPFLPAVLGHDSAQAIDVRLRQFVAMFLQLLPRIPLRADELARDAVALLRGEVNAKTRAEF